CGAISGWHSLCCSGVAPKCVSRESDIRVVAYGGWLLESMIAVVALTLACLLYPQDYFAINTSPSVYASLNMQPIELQRLSNILGFNLTGKTGGIVSFSVSAAKTLAALFGEENLRQLYLFMVAWTAVFIMPIMDHGTRMARYFVQDALGVTAAKPREWWVSTLALTGIAAFLWSYLLQTGTISTIWPTFGICNQLMASIGLTAATAYVLRKRRPIYGLVTFWPVLVFASASIHGATIKILHELLPTRVMAAYVQTAILILFIMLFLVTLIDAVRAYIRSLCAQMRSNRTC
ncbi:MAG: carbon starvation CstA 5TM domain-containing protein, partial [Candidatus Bathyarchaeia archaeon]